MAVFKTIDIPAEQIRKSTAEVREQLLAAGFVLGPDFESVGYPSVSINDTTSETYDPAAFKDRLVLLGKLYSGDCEHTPGGRVRFTIIRWGKGPDEAGFVRVGKGTDLHNTSIVSYIGVTIGDNVHLEPRVVIMDSPGHPIDRRLPDIPENRRQAPITIHDHAWIGYGATILPGVTIGRNAVVKPYSVVMWDVPEDGIVGGNPAKSMKIFKKYFAQQAQT